MEKFDIHLVCGSTGAGKTTYALSLCPRIGAASFSIDEWMSTLFWMDSPQPLQAEWSLERVDRCLGQIWRVALQVARCGVPCVLDVGLSRAAERKRFFDLANEAGLTVQLHFLDVPAEERWRRVVMRNAGREKSRQLDFEITREMFDFVESIWEPPTEDELLRMSGLRVGGD